MPVSTIAGSPEAVKIPQFMSPTMIASLIDSAWYTSRASSTIVVSLCVSNSASTSESFPIPLASISVTGSRPCEISSGSQPGRLPYATRSYTRPSNNLTCSSNSFPMAFLLRRLSTA